MLYIILTQKIMQARMRHHRRLPLSFFFLCSSTFSISRMSYTVTSYCNTVTVKINKTNSTLNIALSSTNGTITEPFRGKTSDRRKLYFNVSNIAK